MSKNAEKNNLKVFSKECQYSFFTCTYIHTYLFIAVKTLKPSLKCFFNGKQIECRLIKKIAAKGMESTGVNTPFQDLN
jgi:hypothetical protein